MQAYREPWSVQRRRTEKIYIFPENKDVSHAGEKKLSKIKYIAIKEWRKFTILTEIIQRCNI